MPAIVCLILFDSVIDVFDIGCVGSIVFGMVCIGVRSERSQGWCDIGQKKGQQHKIDLFVCVFPIVIDPKRQNEKDGHCQIDEEGLDVVSGCVIEKMKKKRERKDEEAGSEKSSTCSIGNASSSPTKTHSDKFLSSAW